MIYFMGKKIFLNNRSERGPLKKKRFFINANLGTTDKNHQIYKPLRLPE